MQNSMMAKHSPNALFKKQIYTVNGEVQSDDLKHHVGNLEAEVRKLVDLKVKLEKIDTLLEGLESLCSKVNAYTKSGNIGDDKDVKNPEEKVDGLDEDGLVDFVPSFKVISVESGGLIDNTITVKVTFRSKKACSIRWNVLHENSTFLLLEGEIYEKMISGNVRMCAAIIELTEVDSLEWVFANIFGIDDHVQLTFNITALHKGGAEPIEEFGYKILRYSPIVTLDKDRADKWGIETTFKVSDNVMNRIKDEYPSLVHGSFQYINTTTTPAKIMIKFGFMNEDIAVEKKNGTENELVVRVKNEIAKFGGLFYLSVKQGETTYLSDHQYDVNIRVLMKDSDNIMPEGVVAVYEQEEIQYYHGQYYSVKCVGGSIPAPDVQLYKIESSGQLNQLPVDVDVFENIFHLKVINFFPANIEQLDGDYVCRVSLGNEYVDQRITVFKFEEIKFDKIKTGVVENSRKQILVSCKATGTPTPYIELFVNDDYGQDMIQSSDDRYTHTLMTHKNTVEVMMKIKPVNPDIHTVFCVAYQRMDGEIAYRRKFPIDIKPTV